MVGTVWKHDWHSGHEGCRGRVNPVTSQASGSGTSSPDPGRLGPLQARIVSPSGSLAYGPRILMILPLLLTGLVLLLIETRRV